MKTLPALAFSVFLAFQAQAQKYKIPPGQLEAAFEAERQAQIDESLRPIAQNIVAFACKDRFRKSADGKLYDLAPRFFDAQQVSGTGTRQFFASKPLPEWYLHLGKVISVPKSGILVRSFETLQDLVEDNYNYEVVFIRNYPYTRVDGDIYSCFTLPDGTYRYEGPGGAIRTVKAYDYGTEPTDFEKGLLDQTARARAANLQSALAEQKAKSDEATRKKKSEMDANVLKLLQIKAKEGEGSYQFRLGEHYFKTGDLSQAEFWLTCACTNGQPQATNLLEAVRAREFTNSIVNHP